MVLVVDDASKNYRRRARKRKRRKQSAKNQNVEERRSNKMIEQSRLFRRPFFRIDAL